MAKGMFYKGKVFRSLAHFCRINDLDYCDTYDQMKRGIPLEDIVLANLEIDPNEFESEEELLKALEEIEENENRDWRDKHRYNEFGLDPYDFETQDDFLKALDRETHFESDSSEQDCCSTGENTKNNNKLTPKIEPVKEKLYLISQMLKGTKDIFESNPYCVLGIPCNSTRSVALETQDKFKKLHKLGAIATYNSNLDLKFVERPKRDIGNLNVVLNNLEKLEYRWFWFLVEDYSKIWNKPILLNSNHDCDIDYDKFLARYITVLVIDPLFKDSKKWSFVIKLLDWLCSLADRDLYKILSTRISEIDKKKYNYRMITGNFREKIFEPLAANIMNTDGNVLYNVIKLLYWTEGQTKEKISPIINDAVSQWIESSLYTLVNFIKQIESKKKLSQSTSSEASEALLILNKLEESFLQAEKITAMIGGLQSEAMMNKFASPIYNATIVLQSGGKRVESYKYDSLIYKYCDEFQRKEIKRVTPSSYLNSA